MLRSVLLKQVVARFHLNKPVAVRYRTQQHASCPSERGAGHQRLANPGTLALRHCASKR